MTIIDWIIIVLYLIGLIGLSAYLGKGQSSQDDYYVGNRTIPWWAVGISTMATQTSAISFISIPAFVALKDGGGLTWLQYELAVPLAMIVVMIFLIPLFRTLNLISVYEYLELRFGSSVRNLISGVFLISRGLATGVGLYASAIVLSVALDFPLWSAILIIGIITIIYDVIGGITAVIYSDVIQMLVLVGGIIICIVYAVIDVGGIGTMFSAMPPERLLTTDFSTGLGDGGTVPFWGFLFGGLFLYVSYYGTDQSQVQRGLSAKSVNEAKKALLLNGLARFPLTILYILLGIASFAVYQQSPELSSAIPADKPDYLIPEYILLMLPTGLRALLFAALLAAAMSSLDSALNSLSASTMRDFIQKWRPESNQIKLGKIVTLIWGVMIIMFAFIVGGISDTVIEAINKIGSAFYGPILAAFLVGILSRKVTTRAVIFGILIGVTFNITLWLGFSEIHWMWWNIFGCLISASVSVILSLKTTFLASEKYTLNIKSIISNETQWSKTYLFLVCYFILILCVLLYV